MQTLDKEATRLIRREAYVRALRIGIEAVSGDTEMPDAQQMRLMALQAMGAFDKQADMIFGRE